MKGRIGMLTPLDSATGKPPSTGFPTPLLSGKQQPTGGISTKSVRAKADAGLIGRGGHASIMPEQGLPRVDSARRRSTGWRQRRIDVILPSPMSFEYHTVKGSPE